jgi:hypothetical protein
MLDGSTVSSAKPPSVRRHVDRKILRFSLLIGAASALLAALVYFASAYPALQEAARKNGRAFDEIHCARGSCDTTQFTTDAEPEEADYVIYTDDRNRRFFLAFPPATEDEAEYFWLLGYFDSGFIRQFRRPALFPTLDGETWRLYSLDATVEGRAVEILIGYAMKAPWKIVETPRSLLGLVDSTLEREANELARNLPLQKSISARSRLGLSSDGFLIVDASTGRGEAAGSWVPAFMPNLAILPRQAYRFHVHGGKLYLLETEWRGQLLVASLINIGSLWWLASLCAVAFLGMSVLARAVSRRYLRRYFALLGIPVPSLEEALRIGEGPRVEFKRGLSDEVARSGSVDNELLKSITAFANTNDGAILVGIDDGGHVEGLDLDFKSRDAWERRIHQLVRARIKPTPPIQVTFEDLRGMLVGKISVARGEAPVYMLEGLVYLRQGSSDVKAQPDDIISLVAEFAF